MNTKRLGSARLCRAFQGFTGFYTAHRALASSTGLDKGLQGSTELHKSPQGSTRLCKALRGSTGLYKAQQGCAPSTPCASPPCGLFKNFDYFNGDHVRLLSLCPARYCEAPEGSTGLFKALQVPARPHWSLPGFARSERALQSPQGSTKLYRA